MRKTILALGLIGLTASTAWSVPQLLNFQGRLLESGSASAGNRSMTFRIFNSQSGGATLFSEARTIPVSAGIFNVLIGETTSGGIPASVFDGADKFVEVQVDSLVLPRQRIASVGYAFRSDSAAVADKANSLAQGATIQMTIVNLTTMTATNINVTSLLATQAVVLGEFKVGFGLDGVYTSGANNRITFTQPAATPIPLIRTAAPGQQGIAAMTGNTPLNIDSGLSGILNLNPTSSGGILIGNGATGVAGITLNAGTGQVSSPSQFSLTGPVTLGGSTLTVTGQNAAGFSLSLSSGLNTPTGTVNAGLFVGNGAGLTNVMSTDPTKVSKAGDTMTGQLTILSTLTVQGNAFSVGGSILAITNGNVGIGTTSPMAALHVVGANSALGNASPGAIIAGGNNSSTGATSNGGPILMTAGGNIPAGTTGASVSIGAANSGASGSATLAGGNNPSNGLGASVVIGGGFVNGGSVTISGGVGSGGGEIGGNAVLNAGSGAAGSGILQFEIAGSEKMRVGSNGNVGIGTASPQQSLDVDGAAQFGSDVNKSTFTATPGGMTYALQLSSGVTLANGGPLNLTPNGFIRFGDGSVQTSAPAVAWTKTGAVVALTNATDNTVVQSTLTVQGNAFSVGGSTLVVTNGNVGIGTIAPTAALHVVGADSALGNASPGAIIAGGNNSGTGATSSGGPILMTAGGNIPAGTTGASVSIGAANSGASGSATLAGGNNPSNGLGASVVIGGGFVNGGSVTISGGAGSGGGEIGGNAVLNAGSGAAGSGILQFEIAGSEIMRVGSSGNVGIGTTAPNTKFQVAGGDMHTSGAGNGLILKSPDGLTCQRISIPNGGGSLVFTTVTCP